MEFPKNVFEFLMRKCDDKFHFWPGLSERDRFVIYHVCKMISVWMKAHNAILVVPTSGIAVNENNRLHIEKTKEFALYLIGPDANTVISNNFRLYDEEYNNKEIVKRATRATIYELAIKLLDELYKEELK